MNILFVIVHHWNPKGSGTHQSLRPNPNPRIAALQSQILSFLRYGPNQSLFHMVDRAVYRTNESLKHNISIKIVTDGSHHVLEKIHPSFVDSIHHISVDIDNPKLLGFEAHKVLADNLSLDYDYYCYLEDDIVLFDPSFFDKLSYFDSLMGSEYLLLPHRFEQPPYPHVVDLLYIDGPIHDSEFKSFARSDSNETLSIPWFPKNIPVCKPSNPHSGCFFLTKEQLTSWSSSSCWLDFDTSFISPLESSATLGISKTFKCYKPSSSHSSWFNVQHFGDSFHCLIS